MNPEPVSEITIASREDARRVGLRYVTDDEPGIARRVRGKGFTYVDAHGATVKDPGTLERIRDLAIPPAWQSVWICASEKGHLQAAGRDAKMRKQYIYHPSYREARDFNKFNHVISFGAALPRIRRIVSRDLGRPGLPKRRVMALLVRLLDQTCLRIGNDEYARKNGSYGLTTLKNDHVEIHGAEIRFQFRAKSGVVQDISLNDARLARMVRQERNLDGEDLFQYQGESGEFYPVQSSDVNDYLREIAKADFTAKDFRTWHGTVQMLMELSQCGPATSATDAKRRLSAAVKATAERLGNRPATCRGYYIHPDVIESYLTSRLFKALVDCSTRSPHSYEAALLKLVKKVQRPSIRMNGRERVRSARAA
ncbi:MAG TPA: DNA topoisomerase IB [Bryobacteraceae bacterium]